ncbi:MAG: ABC transporter permease [Archaeoglobi archaeon]|nr:ABC transporter permease [Candidatus Mnemosynella sp.]
MHPVLNVARKEFFDHLTSKRFLILLVAMLFISAISLSEGIQDYKEQLENYKETLSEIESGSLEVPPGYMPSKPSPLFIFQSMNLQITMIGVILAIAMGFDLISGERERGSLKVLLSHPLFRDDVINGKALGGLLALFLAISVITLLSLSATLIFGIVPSAEELLRIVTYVLFSTLYLFVFFSISLMTSVIMKNSTNALILSLIIFIVLSAFIPILSWQITEKIVGEPPEPPEFRIVTPVTEGGEVVVKPVEISDEEMQEYREKMREYWEKRARIQEFFNLLDPSSNYNRISYAILSPYYYTSSPFGEAEKKEGLLEIISALWRNIMSLIVYPIVTYGIAYMKFMRMDVR